MWYGSTSGVAAVTAIPPGGSSESGAEGIGGLLLIRETRPGQADRLYLPLNDGLGNVCGLIDAADGSLAAEYDYDPYGNPVVARGPAMDACPFRHRTRYYDPETWLYYYGYRYYDPAVTKWISKDPLGEAGGWNLTCFCGNDPVNRFDPLGLAAYFFGGTGNSLDEDAWSNVEILYRSWDRDAGHGVASYVSGVMSGYAPDGTPYKGLHNTTAGMLKEGIWGETFEARAAEMMKHLKAQLAAGDKEVNIFGFSRGSLTALVFLNMIKNEAKDNLLFKGIYINQTVLFDNVEHTDRNTPHELPAGLKYTHQPLHLVAVDEQRKQFYDPDVLNMEGAVQIGFRGVHANVGGGQKNADMLAAQSLYFVAEAMRKSKVNAIDNGVLWNQMEQHGMHKNGMASTPSDNDRFFYTMGARAFPSGMFLSPLFRFNRSLLKNPLDVNAFNEFNSLDMDRWAGGQMFSPETGWGK